MAIDSGTQRPVVLLTDRYLNETGTHYLTGVQALVRAIRDRARHDARAGTRTASFVSGYEGSPLAGFDMELARRLPIFGDVDIVHRPAVNEELAATAVLGTQLARQTGSLSHDGVTGYWYGKAPGLDRAADAIRHANLIGTDPAGGAVALIGDDPEAKSSTYPCTSEAAVADLYLPTLYPADSQEALDYAMHAAYLSRFTGTWAGLKVHTVVADGGSVASLDRDRIAPTFGDLGPSRHVPSATLIGPNLASLEESLLGQRFPRAVQYARLNGLNQIVADSPQARIGIVASGKTYLDVREALARLGVDDGDGLARYGIRVLKLGMVYPVDPEIVATFAAGLTEIIVVEEKRGFLEDSIKSALYRRASAPQIVGKVDDRGRALFSAAGALDVDKVMIGLARRLGEGYGVEPAKQWMERPRPSRIALPLIPLMPRTPYFCSGCPHSSSTKADKDTLVGGGIGCHALVMVMDEEHTGKVLGVTQMGGEGAQWIGMAPFVEQDHFLQNIGDGTFTHSGSLALRAAVAAGVNITYKLLYNSAVAMTGGQQPAGVIPLARLVELLAAEGVAEVVVTTDDVARTRKEGGLRRSVVVRHRDELESIQRRLASVPGVTVLIHDQECAAEKRRKRKRGKAETPATRVVINERVCEGCGDCGVQSNCLSVRPVDTEFGRKTEIHQSSCNLDFSCLKGDCPSFVTVTPRGERRPHEVSEVIDDAAAAALPNAPDPAPGDFAMRIVGIGGTGIVTVAQVLATAADLDGRYVRSLDQIGLAQKGGAVVSDLKISIAPIPRASKLSAETCDIYLVCDSLAGADPTNLRVLSAEQSTSIVSSTEIPTGQMIVDTELSFPDSQTLQGAIEGRSRRAIHLDAGALARDLFGDEQYSNMLMVGAAFQAAGMPMSASAVEDAITLNDTAVDRNIQAFRWGRRLAAEKSALAPARPPSTAGHVADWVGVPADEAISLLLHEVASVRDPRAAELTRYQNSEYAQRYRDELSAVLSAEQQAKFGSTVLTAAVARYLYKLMAYKDEYEVARLIVDEDFAAEVKEEFGANSRLAFRLHPPMLRAMGMKQKMSFGPRSIPIFRVLYAMRGVRGTALDPFGYAAIRRLERELITEYVGAIRLVAAGLTAANLDAAVEIAELPDMVRGYEHVKTDNAARYRQRLAELLVAFATTTVQAPETQAPR
jgi:indolepyruvate ferredoxin oxidoreductase